MILKHGNSHHDSKIMELLTQWNYSPSGITHPYNYQNCPEYWDTPSYI